MTLKQVISNSSSCSSFGHTTVLCRKKIKGGGGSAQAQPNLSLVGRGRPCERYLAGGDVQRDQLEEKRWRWLVRERANTNKPRRPRTGQVDVNVIKRINKIINKKKKKRVVRGWVGTWDCWLR
jgi:hypothetical protein